MSAEVIPFRKPSGRQVEIAWATHRAFIRAEAADIALLDDPLHRKAKEQAKTEFLRLYNEWIRG